MMQTVKVDLHNKIFKIHATVPILVKNGSHIIHVVSGCFVHINDLLCIDKSVFPEKDPFHHMLGQSSLMRFSMIDTVLDMFSQDSFKECVLYSRDCRKVLAARIVHELYRT